MKEKKLRRLATAVAVVLVVAILSLFIICLFNSGESRRDKFIFAKHKGVVPYSEGIRQLDLSSETEQSVSIELADVFSDSAEYEALMQNREFVPDSEIDRYVMQVRSKCKQFYSQKRAEFLTSAGIDDRLVEPAGYSHILEINKEVLKAHASPAKLLRKMAKSSLVRYVVIDNCEDFSAEPAAWFGSWQGETLPTINGQDYVGIDYMQGEGVNLGILEALSTKNDSGYIRAQDVKAEFPDLNVLSSNSRNYETCSHGQTVARVIGNMAPKCNMYIDVCHPLNNTYIFNTSNFSWFLENNVSVVNCSWGGGHKTSDVNYCRMENLVNQLSLDNLITFVFAAGNNGGMVGCPSSAANVICVGATDATGKKIADYSNFGSAIHSGCKPTMVANGTPHLPQQSNPFHATKGTSFSAPMVTAAIAMQMSSEPRFKLYPERLIPLLVATADNGKIKGFAKNQFGLDAKAGGGMLDLKKFLDFPGQCDSFTANSAGTVSFTYKYYVPKQSEIGKTLKICLFWMSTDTFRGGNTSDAEQYDISNPSLLSMQLRAKVGSDYVGTIGSDGLKSNVLVLYVPINSLTPITVEINALSSGRTTKGAVAYCVQ